MPAFVRERVVDGKGVPVSAGSGLEAPAAPRRESRSRLAPSRRFQFSLRSCLLAVFFAAPMLGLLVLLRTTSDAARLPRGEVVEHAYFTLESGTLNSDTFSDEVTCAHWKIAPKPEFGRAGGQFRLLCGRQALPGTFQGPVEVLCRKRRVIESCATCSWEVEVDVWGRKPATPGAPSARAAHLLYWKTALPMEHWGRARLEDATSLSSPPREPEDDHGVSLRLATPDQATYLAAARGDIPPDAYPRAEAQYENTSTAFAARVTGLPGGPDAAIRWLSVLWCVSLLPAIPAVVWSYLRAA